MYASRLFFKIVEKTFPMQDVNAIGRKLATFFGSSCAEPFGIDLMTPTFQASGTDAEYQQVL